MNHDTPSGENTVPSRIDPPVPDDNSEFWESDDTGFAIICFKRGTVDELQSDLLAAARAKGFERLIETLNRLSLKGESAIVTVPPEKLLRMEEEALTSEYPPLRSLTQYWRLDARAAGLELKRIEEAFENWPEVEELYREKTSTSPGGAANQRPPSNHYLNAAPVGIDARWVWDEFPEADGSGLIFTDVEMGWTEDHPNLPPAKLIFEDNHPRAAVRSHGGAVLSIIGALGNHAGPIGIVPKLSEVRLASIWKKDHPHNLHVAEAIVNALCATPRTDVLLIEFQRGTKLLPAETDSVSFLAIRLAAAAGIVVVEAAGNKDADLNVWVSRMGGRLLDRRNSDFDSGSILVGAASASVVGDAHRRWRVGHDVGSNHGTRVDCYAWGEEILTIGFVDRESGHGDLNTHYKNDFGGTSGASAIMAGAALLLLSFCRSRGLHLSPKQARELLSDANCGTKQHGTNSDNIGVMPSLRRIIETHLSP